MTLSSSKFRFCLAGACMNIDDLAKASGLSTSTLYKAMQGKRVTPKTLGLIAKTLEVNVADLIDLERSKHE